MARCIAPNAQIFLRGTKGHVNIGPGTEVDLDQVIGESNGKPETVADHLGPNLMHLFELTAPSSPRSARRTATRTASHEE